MSGMREKSPSRFGDRNVRQANLRRLAFEWRRIRRMSLATVAWKAVLKLLGLALGLLLLPVAALLHLGGYRHVRIFTDRIGHLALEPDCLIKEQALGLAPHRKWIMLAPPGRVSNEHLLAYWQPHFLVVRNRWAGFLVASLSRWGLMRHDMTPYILAVGRAQAAYRIHREWGKRPPFLALTRDDVEWGREMLARMGIPGDAWFACVHAREAGFSPIDEELQQHRNSSIENAIPAMQEIVRRGGWVIRIGDPTMKPLPPVPGVIDYAHSPYKSARMDIVLCAQARFILGNTSGIGLVGTVFGVPCAVANLIPLSTLWFGECDISIPKLFWSRELERYLRIDEILDSPAANFHYASLYAESKIDPVENSAEDILMLAAEMLDRLDGHYMPAEGDAEIADRVRRLFTPRHIAYGSAAGMAASFLRHHPELLPPPDHRASPRP